MCSKCEALRREGPPQRKTTDPPPVHLLNPRPTHSPADFIQKRFFLVCFWVLLGKESSKTAYKYFCKKSMSKTFPQKSTTKCHFPLDFFVLSRFFGVSRRWELKKNYEKVTNKSCRKAFIYTKQLTKNPKTIFFLICFYHVFGRFGAFLGEGSSKTP
jgi:hypothetical protein